MKFTSIFVAASLFFCQAVLADSVGLAWWTGANFTGDKDDNDLQPGILNCASLDSSIQSVQIDPGVSCTFFNASDCMGLNATLQGECPTVPPPFPNVISYYCMTVAPEKF